MLSSLLMFIGEVAIGDLAGIDSGSLLGGLEGVVDMNRLRTPRMTTVVPGEATQELTEEQVGSIGQEVLAKIVRRFDLLPGEDLRRRLPNGGMFHVDPNRNWIWIESPGRRVNEGDRVAFHRDIAKMSFTPEGAVVEGVDLSKSIDAMPINQVATLRFFEKMLRSGLKLIPIIPEGPFSANFKYLTGEPKVIVAQSSLLRPNTEREIPLRPRLYRRKIETAKKENLA